jgi:hypothetical protein
MTGLVATILLFLLFNFIYESILAPSLRLQLRFRLHHLRDELRNLKFEGVGLDDNHFRYLRDSINILSRNLTRFDAAMLVRIGGELRRNSEVRRRGEARCAAIDDCDLAEARFIRHECNRIGVATLVVNCGCAAIYVLPIALVLVGFSKLQHRIRVVLSLSERDFAKVTQPGWLNSGSWRAARPYR